MVVLIWFEFLSGVVPPKTDALLDNATYVASVLYRFRIIKPLEYDRPEERHLYRSRAALRFEDEPGSNSGVDDFVAELITSEVVEPISGAMAGNQVIRIDLL
jgi:hypothetical protein